MKFRFGMVAVLALACAIGLSTFTGCRGSLKPVPVAEGSDEVVVFAERIQRSSLGAFKEVTEWEFTHRAVLPKEVSQQVDSFREYYPDAYRLSRKALDDYKKNRGADLSEINRATAALATAQAALYGLQHGQSENEVTQANNAVTSLIASIRELTQ